jgi:GTPase SAR1 family protein
MGDLPSIRVLLIGEAGVGKSSIASVLSDDIFNYIYSPTFGAKMHVAFFSTLQGEMEYCVEILEVGGSHRFTASRSIFYDNTDAIIFMYAMFTVY